MIPRSFLRAALNPRSLPAKLIFDLGHLFILAISPGIQAEITDVLNRADLRAKFPGLNDESAARTLAVVDAGRHVEPEDIPSVSRDSKDDIFLATAVISGAHYLVTEDHRPSRSATLPEYSNRKRPQFPAHSSKAR